MKLAHTQPGILQPRGRLAWGADAGAGPPPKGQLWAAWYELHAGGWRLRANLRGRPPHAVEAAGVMGASLRAATCLVPTAAPPASRWRWRPAQTIIERHECAHLGLKVALRPGDRQECHQSQACDSPHHGCPCGAELALKDAACAILPRWISSAQGQTPAAADAGHRRGRLCGGSVAPQHTNSVWLHNTNLRMPCSASQ